MHKQNKAIHTKQKNMVIKSQEKKEKKTGKEAKRLPNKNPQK